MAAIVVKITALVLSKGLVAIIVDFVIVALAFVWSMFGKTTLSHIITPSSVILICILFIEYL